MPPTLRRSASRATKSWRQSARRVGLPTWASWPRRVVMTLRGGGRGGRGRCRRQAGNRCLWQLCVPFLLPPFQRASCARRMQALMCPCVPPCVSGVVVFRLPLKQCAARSDLFFTPHPCLDSTHAGGDAVRQGAPRRGCPLGPLPPPQRNPGAGQHARRGRRHRRGHHPQVVSGPAVPHRSRLCGFAVAAMPLHDASAAAPLRWAAQNGCNCFCCCLQSGMHASLFTVPILLCCALPVKHWLTRGTGGNALHPPQLPASRPRHKLSNALLVFPKRTCAAASHARRLCTACK